MLTAQFFTGTGPSIVNFGGGSFGSEGMASTDGVNTALNDYYMTGRTSGLYTFGAAEVIRTGFNSMGQMVGSFNWNITPAQGGISLQLTNYTSLWSLAYHHLPSHSRSSFDPLGTTQQTYTMFVPCK